MLSSMLLRRLIKGAHDPCAPFTITPLSHYRIDFFLYLRYNFYTNYSHQIKRGCNCEQSILMYRLKIILRIGRVC